MGLTTLHRGAFQGLKKGIKGYAGAVKGALKGAKGKKGFGKMVKGAAKGAFQGGKKGLSS